MTNLSPRRQGLRPVAAWAGAAALVLGALFGSSGATAAAPPANTLIGNQATMAFIDPTGAAQITSSNIVYTQVQQVGSFTLDAVNQLTDNVQNTKTGAGGTTVYAPHVVTNLGNGTDSFKIELAPFTSGTGTFTKVEIFASDASGAVVGTTPLCSSTGTPVACSAGILQTIGGNGGTFPFVVAYTIPAGTVGPIIPFASEKITVTPATTALYVAPNTSASDVDMINVTSLAAFSATKGFGAPAVLPPSGNWPSAGISGPASSAACGTTFPVTQSATCDYTVYTITYRNTGAIAGGFYMNDVLPAGFTFVTGSAVWSGASGVSAATNPSGITFTQAGQTVSVLVPGVNPNVSGTVSFVVLVNSTAAVGTSTTTNTASYDALTSTKTTGAGTETTNPSPFTVTATYGVVLGTATGTATTSLDAPAGTPLTTAADVNTVLSATAGSSVSFAQTVFNTGNASDTFNMSVSTAIASTYPAGTTFAFYAVDGATPLLDTNGDGIVDSGSVGAQLSKTIVVKANIPASAAAGTGPFTVVVVATSTGDSTKFDASRDNVTSLSGILVDLTNTTAGTGTGSVGNGDLGQGPSPLPTTTTSTAAGTGAIFTLFVKNNDPAAQIYTLAASQTASFPGSLPVGWTVKFVAAGAGCAGTALTTTGSIAAGAQLQVDACVTPPVSAPIGVTTNVYFKVVSTTNAFASDVKTDAVNVNSAPLTFSATLTPFNTGSIAAGSTVVYPHTLNATGGQSCGTYTLNAVQSAANVAAGWTYALFIDVDGDGQIGSGDTPVIAGSTVNPALLLGVAQKILVRVFAPAGAAAGAQDVVTVTATFAAANGGTCAPASNTDTSTLVTGLMRGDKSQALDANCDGVSDSGVYTHAQIPGKPGQCVLYRIVATNQGAAPVTNLSINDVAPAYTTLTAAPGQPTAQCTAGAGTSTPVSYVPTGNTVKCGTAATVMPGGTLQLDFSVRIDQ